MLLLALGVALAHPVAVAEAHASMADTPLNNKSILLVKPGVSNGELGVAEEGRSIVRPARDAPPPSVLGVLMSPRDAPPPSVLGVLMSPEIFPPGVLGVLGHASVFEFETRLEFFGLLAPLFYFGLLFKIVPSTSKQHMRSEVGAALFAFEFAVALAARPLPRPPAPDSLLI